MSEKKLGVVDWSIPGAEDQPIFGTTHLPDTNGMMRGSVLLCHGFKGYKDYGFFPYLAASLADAGFVAHRFNFSHSGVTPNYKTFQRLDLFERDTWNKQVHDLSLVHDALREGWAPGPKAARSLPVIWFGHSRGGISVLLAAARRPCPTTPEDSGDLLAPSGLCLAATPASSCTLPDEQKVQLRKQGYLEQVSGRTGQTMRIGRQWLEEIEADPVGHDPLAAISSVRQPVSLIHGERDSTVPVSDAKRLHEASEQHASLHLVAEADHTFNTSNPLEGQAPEATRRLARLLIDFSVRCTVNAINSAG